VEEQHNQQHSQHTAQPTNPPTTSGFTVYVDSVAGTAGQQVVLPVYFANVPSSGVSTADMTILYDASKLEYVSGAAGSIVTDPSTNFAVNKDKDGSIKLLFLDYTMKSGAITTSGVFANLTFKVLSSTTATATVNKATFGDNNLRAISATLNSGSTVQPVAPTTPPQGSTGDFTVKYSQTSWGTGATVSVEIKNTGSSAVNGWTLDFNYPGNQKITNAWNCTYNQSGNAVSLSNANYNGSIPPGGSVTVGFNISYSGTNTEPTSFTVK